MSATGMMKGFNRIFLPWRNDTGKMESEYANYCYNHAREVPDSRRRKSNEKRVLTH
jgi:hypothetical protein